MVIEEHLVEDDEEREMGAVKLCLIATVLVLYTAIRSCCRSLLFSLT